MLYVTSDSTHNARRIRWLVVFALGLVMWSGIASAVSTEEEVKLGQEENRKVIAQFGIYRDKALQDYVDKVGQRVAKQSSRPELQYHFTVIDDPMVNAFAIPGGYVYIARGMLAALNSESELAGVLGHEIAHITQRHAFRSQNRSKVMNVLSAVASVATGTPGVYELGDMASSVLLKGYSREFELEADRVGATYMAKAGYDPSSMIKTIETLKAQERIEIKEARIEDREPNIQHGFLASHPDNDTRYKQAIEEAEKLHAEYHEFIKSDEFLEKLNGLAWGDSHQVGIVRKSTFYHRGLGIKFSFPDGWRVESMPRGVAVVSTQGKAMLSLSTAPYRPGTDGKAYVQQLGLSLRSGRDVNIGGLPGFLGIADRVETSFGPRPVRFAVLFDANRHVAFLLEGAGKHDLHNIANDRDFIATIFSFDRMDREDFKQAVRPRLQVVKAEPGTTMESLAARSAITNYALDKLRVMNEMYPDGEPEPGQLIKIVD